MAASFLTFPSPGLVLHRSVAIIGIFVRQDVAPVLDRRRFLFRLHFRLLFGLFFGLLFFRLLVVAVLPLTLVLLFLCFAIFFFVGILVVGIISRFLVVRFLLLLDSSHWGLDSTCALVALIASGKANGREILIAKPIHFTDCLDRNHGGSLWL